MTTEASHHFPRRRKARTQMYEGNPEEHRVFDPKELAEPFCHWVREMDSQRRSGLLIDPIQTPPSLIQTPPSLEVAMGPKRCKDPEQYTT